jgi:ribosomal protein S18 acetylase RimI-like enzyme
LDARLAGAGDVEAVVETISLAFQDDPVWSWAFPDEERRRVVFRRWWRLFVESMWPQGFTWTTAQVESVAVWAVPNGMELTREAESSIPKMLDDAVGSRAPTVLEALLQFEAARPHDEPHYYLSIVATHDDHRGYGFGESLLGQNLELVDARHLPAYLESSNPKNLARYERLGFRPREEFMLPDGGPTVTTMWRVAR